MKRVLITFGLLIGLVCILLGFSEPYSPSGFTQSEYECNTVGVVQLECASVPRYSNTCRGFSFVVYDDSREKGPVRRCFGTVYSIIED